MKNCKIKDFLSATKDEVIDTATNSDFLPEAVQTLGEYVVSEGVATIIGEIIGNVVPGINGIRLSYKQNRFERNIKQTLEIIAKRISALENNFVSLNEEMQDKFKTRYLEWLLDNIYDEKQSEKIPYHVNGYINFMTNETNDNLMLLFFNTLNELTQLDIDVLKMYDMNSEENILTIRERYNLNFEQTMVIKEKLTRLGLLQSKNDEQRYLNIDYVVDYLIAVEKDSKKSKPRGVTLQKSKIKKPNRAESFCITRLGRSYLQIIAE